MSKISIEGNASGTGTLTIAAPNTNSNFTLTIPDEAGTITTSNSPYSTFRNRIINGDMRIDQRNAGASFTVNAGAYALDRFLCAEDTDGTISVQQVTDGPTGFTNSMKFTVGTADASLGATQYVFFRQPIEGFNFADCEFGTANAKTVTVSFWVKSNITGTFGGNIASTGHDRSYAFAYTINSANTWEYKTATIPGDTSGTWNKTNSIGAYLFFCLASGATFLQSTGSWAAGTFLGPTGQTNLMATTANTFNITGVQLEVGSVATPFERRPFGTELSLCQRYFEKSAEQGTAIQSVNDIAFLTTNLYNNIANNNYYSTIEFKVTKRAAPTVTLYPYTTPANTTRWSNDSGTDYAANSAATPNGTYQWGFNVANTSGGTLTVGSQKLIIGGWYASAEL